MKKINSKNKRIVVKFGTENLFNNKGKFDQSVFDNFAWQIVSVQDLGIQVTVVSSGAIAAGVERLSSLQINPRKFTKKELAGIGMRHLLDRWGSAFEKYDREVGQVLVTYANWEEPSERQNVKTSILNYTRMGIIPIINENDVISDTEIKLMEKRISENDRLARMVTELINADGVLFLTNVLGVFENNPKIYPEARLYTEVDYRTANDHIKVDARVISQKGRGGMVTKLKEAIICARLGKNTVIAGSEKDVIIKFIKGEPVGTRVGKFTSSISLKGKKS